MKSTERTHMKVADSANVPKHARCRLVVKTHLLSLAFALSTVPLMAGGPFK